MIVMFEKENLKFFIEIGFDKFNVVIRERFSSFFVQIVIN